MEQYSTYKNSGVRWISNIPVSWNINRIKNVCSIFGRIGFRGYTVNDLVPEGTGAISLSPSNITDSQLYTDDCTFLSWEKYEESPEIQLSVGDVVLVKTGSTIGKVAHIDTVETKMTLNPQLIVLKQITTDARFLYYLISSSSFQTNFTINTAGGSTPAISQEKINNFYLPEPPLSEQEAIASFLDCKTKQIDDLISKKKHLIELKKEERAAMINQAVTKGLNPDVPMKDSEVEYLGEIPEHWEVKKLKYLLSGSLKYGANETGTVESGGNIRYLRITDFDDDGILRNNNSKYLEPYQAAEYMLEEGDVLFARSGATVGKTFQFKNSKLPACFAGYLIQVQPNEDNLLSDFLYFFTKSPSYINWKNSIFIQATIQNIGADKYSSLIVPAPPLKDQQYIIHYIKEHSAIFDNRIQILLKQINLLKEYKSTLISKAVTGKIKVS